MIHYINFDFCNGSNNYITFDTVAFWKMIQKYHVIQVSENVFHVTGRRSHVFGYNDKKDLLREFAIDWQCMFSSLCYSWEDLAFWCDFFETYGKKYGLLYEFHENCIC